MKVLQVIDRLNIGGAERVFINNIRLLVEANIETGALLFNAGFPLDKEIDKAARLHVLKRHNKFSIKKLYQANKVCSGYDIVHVHMRHCYAYIRVAQLLFRGKYRILFHDHYGDIEINEKIPVHLSSILKPKFYVGVSKTLVRWAQHNLSIKPEYVFYLPNTVIPDAAVHYECNADRKNALLVSNIRETKNIGFAIDLCRHLDVGLTIYGNKTSDEYYERIMGCINGNKKTRIVHGETNIYAHCNNYGFAIHSAKSETGPLALLEYMAYGIPFIAYKTGDVAETVAAELPDHFTCSFEKDEWINKIEKWKGSNSSDKLKAVFKKHFGPEKYIAECLRIYQEILS